MNNSKLHRSSIRRRPRAGVMIAAAALLALAAPAVAHVVEATIQPFLSRDYDIVESEPEAFSTFEPMTMLILF